MAEPDAKAALAGEPLLRWFDSSHLPDDLQRVVRHFRELAEWAAVNLPRTAERSAGLRKLLEAKDCLVRAAIEGRG